MISEKKFDFKKSRKILLRTKYDFLLNNLEINITESNIKTRKYNFCPNELNLNFIESTNT